MELSSITKRLALDIDILEKAYNKSHENLLNNGFRQALNYFKHLEKREGRQRVKSELKLSLSVLDHIKVRLDTLQK